jgi:GntR family carbon starvation induced transcriptional regulator
MMDDSVQKPFPGRLAGSVATASLADEAYELVKRDILNGQLPPGTKLRVDHISQRYAIGSSPVREALTRLAAEQFVLREQARGFSVAAVSLEELDELTDTRCLVEEMALRRSIAGGGIEWEEGIVLAYHRLKRVPRPVAGSALLPGSEWLVLHDAFHTALIAACGSRWLLDFCSRMREQSYRYRRESSQERGDGPDEHAAIMEATIAREADVAVARLLAHYRLSAELTARRLHEQALARSARRAPRRRAAV